MRSIVNCPVTVMMVFLALMVMGSYQRIPLQLLPSGYSFPIISIEVPYPNANPSEVERQITRPIEEIMGTSRNSRIAKDLSKTRSSSG